MKILHFSFVGGGRCGGPDQKPEPIGGFYFIFFPPTFMRSNSLEHKSPARAKCPLIKYAVKIKIRDCLISHCEEVLSRAHFGTYKSSVGER